MSKLYAVPQTARSPTCIIDLNDRGHLEQPVERGKPLLVYQAQPNKSLWLAQSEHFDAICKDLIWPGEDGELFGEMLRGIVMSMQPENRWHLELLRNVAACQWRLYRLAKIQHNLIGQQSGNGRHGLPNGTLNALEYEQEQSRALTDLQRSIQIYKTVTGKKLHAEGR